MTTDALVQLRGIVKEFPVKAGSLFCSRGDRLQAVAGVSLELRRGETLGRADVGFSGLKVERVMGIEPT